MDDGVVLEPLVGNRVQHSLNCLDDTMRLVWGPEGVNVEKMAEEGHPSSCQLLWGLHMNFDELQVSLPEPKRMKAKYLLAEATLQRGCRTIPLKLLRELAGSAQALPAHPLLPDARSFGVKGSGQIPAPMRILTVCGKSFGTLWTLSGSNWSALLQLASTLRLRNFSRFGNC